MSSSAYLLQIHSIIRETSDTKSFVFQLVSGERLSYQPGQFLTLLLPSNQNIRRSYSLSSHPVLDDRLRITVKRIPNGEYSRWLFDDAKVGDVVESIGASGYFTLPKLLANETTVLFLAAGSGITPIYSLLQEVLYFQTQRVILIGSNRSKEDIIFHEALEQLKSEFGERLHLELLVSNNQNLLRARLSKALLTELIHQLVSDKSKIIVYLCGPRDYMQMALITLINESITLENIRTEIFNTEKPKIRELPPDTDEHTVYINYQRKRYSLQVKYPNTILQTAQLAGIELPYSCEAGRCGTCAATCVKGKIWMSRNEVLLDKEINKGRVLTCTAYPIEGDVEINVKN